MPRRSDSRQRMVDAAARLFRRQGYAATGWRQIVAESGAPWGSQSHFFPGGKEQLAVAALTGEGDRMRQQLAEALVHAHPADMLRRWASATAATLQESGWTEGCPIATVALETAHDSDALAEACSNAFSGWAQTFADEMVRRGTDSAAADALATTVVAATEGALLLARAARDERPFITVTDQLSELLRDRVP